MSVLLRKIGQGYNVLFYELTDVRTRNDWPPPLILASILFTYLYVCKSLGPRLMKNRQPFKLRKTILAYNFSQVILSTYLFYEGMMSGWAFEYSWTCQPVDYSDSATSQRMHNSVWAYIITKLIELLDTIFFVLRKKDRQISGLHLYHHFLMPIFAWGGYKSYPNGHGTLTGVINSFVHIVMYTYYLIAGLGPKYQKYLWWKKHVTSIQLIQFVIIFFHNLIPLFTDCNYPKWIHMVLITCSLHFIYMFGSFYYNNYVKNNTKKIKNGNSFTINGHVKSKRS